MSVETAQRVVGVLRRNNRTASRLRVGNNNKGCEDILKENDEVANVKEKTGPHVKAPKDKELGNIEAVKRTKHKNHVTNKTAAHTKDKESGKENIVR